MDLKDIELGILSGSGAYVGVGTVDDHDDYHFDNHAFTTVKEALEFLKSLVEEEMKKHG